MKVWMNFKQAIRLSFARNGVSPDVYEAAQEKSLTILDATCPNVQMAQKKGML